MLLHELAQHLVLALDLGLQGGDALGVGVGLGAARGALKSGRGVLEERLLPTVELRGLDAQLLAQVGDRSLLDQMAPQRLGPCPRT